MVPEKFPKIETIDDILPWIANKPEIPVRTKNINGKNLTVVCYQIADKNTFDNPYARECRGLVFDSSGKIVCRPFHKFFNVNEREETQEFALKDRKIVSLQPKMDGTMISWFNVDGIWIPKTKKAFERPEIDGALSTPEYLSGSVQRLLFALGRECTATFEYTSPTNKIVVDYKEPHLTLLAVRNNVSGEYLPYDVLKTFAEAAGCRCIESLDKQGIDVLLSQARTKTSSDFEGWVAVFDSGERVKIKTIGYLRAHKLLRGLNLKNVLENWADEKLDDVLAFLRGNGFSSQANDIEKVGEMAQKNVSRTIKRITEATDEILKTKEKIPPENFYREAFQTLGKTLENPGHVNVAMRLLRGQEVSWQEFTKKYLIKDLLEEWTKEKSEICGVQKIGFGEGNGKDDQWQSR